MIFEYQQAEEVTKNWYVIYTKAKQEKKVAQQLNDLGIEAYCPTLTTISNWSDRKKKIEKPLFASYCFVRLSKTNLKSVYNTNGVVGYVNWCGKPAIVKDFEVDEIKRWLNDFNHDEIQFIPLNINEKVTILTGSFKNAVAKVIQQNGKHLTLELPTLGIKLITKTTNICLEKAI